MTSSLQNNLVILEPVSEQNVDLLVRWTLDPKAQGPYKKVPDMTPEQIKDLFLDSEDRWYFLIKEAATDEPLGRFYYRRWQFNPNPARFDWELNIFLANPEKRGN